MLIKSEACCSLRSRYVEAVAIIAYEKGQILLCAVHFNLNCVGAAVFCDVVEGFLDYVAE